MYDCIAVPLDGSPTALAALPTAVRLTTAFGARLALVTVATPAVASAGGTARVVQQGRRSIDELTEPTATEETADAEHRTSGASVELIELEGPDAAEALGRFDADHPRTLLCLSTTGRGAARRALLGSTALQVVRHSPYAVLLVGPACDRSRNGPIEPIIACLDGSAEAEVVVPWVAAWARHTGSTIELIRAIYPFGEPGAADPPTSEQVADLRSLERVAAELAQQGLATRTNTTPREDPLGLIDEALRSAPDGIVALSTSHPGRLAEVLTGSTAAEVVRSSPLPVLITSRADTAPPPD